LLPKEWIPKHSRVYIHLIHQQESEAGIVETDGGDFVSRFKQEVEAAPRFSSSYTPSIKVRFKDINEIPAALQACVQYRLEKRQVTSKWSEIKDKVITFFRSCKSVNEASSCGLMCACISLLSTWNVWSVRLLEVLAQAQAMR
jgi:hypothetical protein